MIMTYIGENSNNHISNADTTGIQILYLFILAVFAILKVGAAIRATTPGLMPLKILSTTSKC